MAEHATVTMVDVATEHPHRVHRWFYISVALLIILFNVVAFGPSIFDASRRNVPLPLTPLVTVHAVLSVVWLLLFLMQTTLVATGRTAIHRRLGIFGAVLTVAFIAVGSFAVIAQARRGFDLSGDLSRLPPPPGADPAAAVVGQLFFLLTFAILFGAAVWHRHRPNVHKRLMLLAVLGGLTPTPVAHVIGHWSVLQPWTDVIVPVSLLILLSISAIHDRVSKGRIHPVSLWVGTLTFVWIVVFNVIIVPSSAWREFATWLTR
jgi:hypothetical protein